MNLSFEAILIGLVALAAFAIFAVCVTSQKVYVATAVSLYMLSQTPQGHTISGLGIATRAFALAVLATACFLRPQAYTTRASRALLATTICGTGAYAVEIYNHGRSSSAIVPAVVYVLVGVLLLSASRTIDAAQLRSGVATAIAGATGLSILLALVAPGTGLVANRLAGIFRDANSTGFFAGLGVVISVISPRLRFRNILLGMSAIALIWTASRSALLAVAVAAVLTGVRVLITNERKRALKYAVAGIACGAIIWASTARQNLLILRTQNTREPGIEYTMEIVRDRPWIGVGYGNNPVEIASTPLRWLAQDGVPALIAVMLAYLIALIISWRHGWTAFLVMTFGITSSLFEGWYLAGGSGLFIAFWLAHTSTLRQPSTSAHPISQEIPIPNVRRNSEFRTR
ncbi:O-antigen ligase family protein [Microlunatus endophyticus]|uniref:O-antigen ligase family protein n=1 Tax=Microlunatus endophyticus TaxID=1716077 RepID=UPI0016655F65|nr:O-antigen ligase family protein [Microlunatus endophyticus]